ncbi:uncharacterized protein LOC124452418 isoform X2 [Xenia sp. Carnegie-2017]|uniref:uncharacterized protein LOC124452418 isoform X2 n=1 Tax=Xenia sp. Carnegie-2017 TaxID=2897299 RepID=UPI001F033443|nr:uncharacterized protein LOC124452418 isoform X2 [Xenia sp. Carnegie-2017]
MSKSYKLLIYKEDKQLLKNTTLLHLNLETGGDLFGLWQDDTTAVLRIAIGPGENCRRTPTAFYQDAEYFGSVGQYLTTKKGLCNIGEWHSHHQLNLPEPSGGDKRTVWHNMPQYGLERFLLIIATIRNQSVNLNGFLFTPPAHGRSSGEMYPIDMKTLPGPNPYRTLPEVIEKCHNGAESSAKKLLEPLPDPLPDPFPNTKKSDHQQKDSGQKRPSRFPSFRKSSRRSSKTKITKKSGSDEEKFLDGKSTFENAGEKPSRKDENHRQWTYL